MVNWLGTKKVAPKANNANEEGLTSPLLPPGSDDKPATTTTTTAAGSSSSPRHNQKRRQSTSLSAKYRRRRSSLHNNNNNADQRRQRRLHNIQNLRHTDSHPLPETETGGEADAFSVNSEATEPHANTTTNSIRRMDTEVTDYGPDDDVKMKREWSFKMMAKIATVMAATTASIILYGVMIAGDVIVSASTASMATLGVAGGWTLLISPLVWVSEWKLSLGPTLRQRINDLRTTAKQFQTEIEIITMEVEELQDEYEILKQSNESLEEIVTKDNKGNVNDLVELVHENQGILRLMKENTRQVVLQDVVKLVLQGDINRDGYINKREANILATRLSISMQTYGIVFDEEKFHRAVGLSPSIPGVMKIVKRLLPNENYNDRLSSSSFYSVDSDSEETDDNDGDGEDEEKDDLYDMFYVPMEEQFGMGDADSIQLAKEFVARKGEQPKLMSISPSLRMSVDGLRCSVGYG